MPLNCTDVFSFFSADELAWISSQRELGATTRAIATQLGCHVDRVRRVTAYMVCPVEYGRPPGVVSDIELPRQIIDPILSEVAKTYNLSVADLLSPDRHQTVALARQDAMWRLRQVEKDGGGHLLSLPQIARILNRGDHTTVLHGVKAHARRLMEAA